MIGLGQGLTPAQQSEAQANFRFGLQLGADQTKQAVAAQNALQQVKMQNEAELERQSALRDQINQERLEEVKMKADLTRDSTDKKFTEDTLKYGIGGLERGQSSFARLYSKVFSSPEKYTDESIDSVSKFFTDYDSVIGQASVDLAGTPAGKIPDFTPYKQKIASIPAPKMQLRQSYEDNTESKTKKNNLWVPASKGGKSKTAIPDDPNEIIANWQYAQSNVEYADSALDSKQKNIDELEKKAAEAKGVDPFAIERKASMSAHSEANDYGATARAWYAAKGTPAQKRLISTLMQQGLVPFDANYTGKIGQWLGERAQATNNINDEEVNNASMLLTNKPLGFWTRAGSAQQTQSDASPSVDQMQQAHQNQDLMQQRDNDRGAALRGTLTP